MNRRLHRTPVALCVVVLLAATSSCKKDSVPEPVAAEPSMPGSEPFTVKLVSSLEAALNDKGENYVPRTKHKSADGSPLYTNRLIKESSPYLLQHAHNPVNWYPWGDEAFAEAKRLGRPVFLSIGYSTCHWCHVMEEESFEDIEIATYLNANYVAIKVDREERPDVDSIYMSALAAMGQKGGWPLNMWLTPERLPFFGGTYFAPRKGVRRAKIGFDEILARAKDQFDTNRERVVAEASKLAAALRRSNAPVEATTSFAGAEILARAGTGYMAKLDRGYGGLLGGRSKFPSSFPIRFMLRYAATLSSEQAKSDAHAAVRLTLDSMRAGGIYDHVGGGFHRYSVDQRWVVPHFEKMLYDNALLALVYLEAFVALGDVNYAGTAADILAYLVREMRSADGGFYSATDADSMTSEGHREEGAFFVWTPSELKAALPAEDAALATEIWGVRASGNFEGRNILLVGDRVADRDPRVLAIRDTLLAERSKRPPPLRDDKVLAAWNGLLLSALSRAVAVLPTGFAPPPPARGKGLDYRRLARETAGFLVSKMVVDGRLRRAYKDGRAYGDAYAEDYAFVIAGLLELFEATGESRWLGEAVALQKTFDKHYRAKGGAYYRTANDAEALLARGVPARDGALPSANSVAALNLRRLYELTSDPKTLEAADALLDSFGDQLRQAPNSLNEMLLAVDFRVGVAKEIVLAGTEGAGFGPLESVLRSSYVPRAVVVRKSSSAPKELAKLVPLSAGKTAIGGRPTAFVCEQTRCELPTSDPDVFAKQLAKTR